ncbi:IclR family transcriptional regulator [Aliagarivorans marinus]|uniref:IclR family transcriptional regulator n=1 Tax=Aliagarivorans marinus TaxID=561965 RepID=UPI00047E496C|nr:IclR family transcriptional regulator [Aliagarivorans marinus]
MTTTESSASKKYAVPALEKGLDVLEFLVTQELPRSQTEIAAALGRSPNEIYRVLVSLEGRGYLLRDELSGKYQATLKIYNLSRRISPIDKMRQCALPHMEDLAFSSGHSCHLCMLYQSQTMVIVHARSHGPVSISIAEGSLFSTTATTSGRVLLANSNPEVRDMILERDEHFTKLSKTGQKALLDQLSEIREQGYHTADSEFTEGVCDTAVLVGEPEGFIIASLAVSSLNTHIGGPTVDQQQMIELLTQTANKIASQLGC